MAEKRKVTFSLLSNQNIKKEEEIIQQQKNHNLFLRRLRLTLKSANRKTLLSRFVQIKILKKKKKKAIKNKI